MCTILGVYCPFNSQMYLWQGMNEQTETNCLHGQYPGLHQYVLAETSDLEAEYLIRTKALMDQCNPNTMKSPVLFEDWQTDNKIKTVTL